MPDSTKQQPRKPRKRLYRPKPLELVLVIWKDSQHDTVYDGPPAGYEPRLALLTNVGFFVKATPEILTLASCCEESTKTTRWYDDIPKAAIRDIVPLARPAIRAEVL